MTKAPQTPLPVFHFAGIFTGAKDIGHHTHDGRREIVFVNKGTITIDVGDLSFKGSTGTLFILPADIPHNQREHGRVQTSFIGFVADATQLPDSPRTLFFSGAAARYLAANIDNLYLLAEKAPALAGGPADALLLAIISFINKYEQESGANRLLPEPLEQALRFINDNVTIPLTVEQIASHACISPSHCTTLFQKHMKTSPIRHLISVRLKLACQLLKNPYLSIKLCAQKCGFDSANYFSRIFRKHLGLSPLEFRASQLPGVKTRKA